MRQFVWKFISVSSLFLVAEPAFAAPLVPFIPLIAGVVGAGASIYSGIQSSKEGDKAFERQQDLQKQQRQFATDDFNRQLELQAAGTTVAPTEKVDRGAPTAQQVRQAQVKSVDEQRSRSGRRSTILTSTKPGRGAKRTTLG